MNPHTFLAVGLIAAGAGVLPGECPPDEAAAVQKTDAQKIQWRDALVDTTAEEPVVLRWRDAAPVAPVVTRGAFHAFTDVGTVEGVTLAVEPVVTTAGELNLHHAVVADPEVFSGRYVTLHGDDNDSQARLQRLHEELMRVTEEFHRLQHAVAGGHTAPGAGTHDFPRRTTDAPVRVRMTDTTVPDGVTIAGVNKVDPRFGTITRRLPGAAVAPVDSPNAPSQGRFALRTQPAAMAPVQGRVRLADRLPSPPAPPQPAPSSLAHVVAPSPPALPRRTAGRIARAAPAASPFRGVNPAAPGGQTAPGRYRVVGAMAPPPAPLPPARQASSNADLHREIQALRDEVAQLRAIVESLHDHIGQLHQQHTLPRRVGDR